MGFLAAAWPDPKDRVRFQNREICCKWQHISGVHCGYPHHDWSLSPQHQKSQTTTSSQTKKKMLHQKFFFFKQGRLQEENHKNIKSFEIVSVRASKESLRNFKECHENPNELENNYKEMSKIYGESFLPQLTLIGSGILRLAARVFNNPASRVVRTTWNSIVLGLDTWTAGMELSGFLNFSLRSSLEHNEKVRASVKPACAICSRSWSDSLLIGYCAAMVLVAGNVLTMLL